MSLQSYQHTAEPLVILTAKDWFSFYENLYDTYFTMFFNVCVWLYILFNIYKAYIHTAPYKIPVTIDTVNEVQEHIQTLDLKLILQQKAIDDCNAMFEDTVKKLYSELATLNLVIHASNESTQNDIKKIDCDIATFKLASEASQKALQEDIMRKLTDHITASETSKKALQQDTNNILTWLGSTPYLMNTVRPNLPPHFPLHDRHTVEARRAMHADNMRRIIQSTLR
ncbi:MAG: hypothetical protein EBU66_19010 [Bacteroidetes bacterium]|nr:hypothetical protein [bacterium]NBP66724.1 hypothetical protein [Bacteroidota bacterium]